MARSSIGVAGLLVGVVACSSSSGGTGGGGNDGQPPSISNLVVDNQQATVPVGQNTLFEGSLDVSDPDGDAQFVEVAATSPNGSTTVPAAAGIQGENGQTSFSVNWEYITFLPVAGTYTVSQWVIDTEGQKSNVLSFTQTAQ